MAVLPILEAPDPFLRTISTPVEAIDDELQKLIDDSLEGTLHTGVRFSPGYGDLELKENQKGVFAVLNPGKYIALSLMDTFIMSPEKSVTAIIGVKEG